MLRRKGRHFPPIPSEGPRPPRLTWSLLAAFAGAALLLDLVERKRGVYLYEVKWREGRRAAETATRVRR